MRSLKEWIKLRKHIIKTKLYLNFLRNCIRSKVFAPKFYVLTKKLGVSLFHIKSIRKIKQLSTAFVTKLIRTEIRDLYYKINFLQAQIYKVSNVIYGYIPVSVCNDFFSRQSGPLFSYFFKEQKRFDKRFKFFIKKQGLSELEEIEPIRYFYIKPTQNNSVNKVLFKLHSDSHTDRGEVSEINVAPLSFVNIPQQVLKDNWFVNLSTVTIPESVQRVLQLGENFSLPSLDKNEVTIEFIKNFENSLKKLPLQVRPYIRNRSAHIINKLPFYTPPRNPLITTDLVRTTKDFLKNNTNLILTRSDKGNVTVALDRDVYIAKIEEILDDTETYKVIARDPTNKLINNLKDILSRWKKSKFISEGTYKSLLCISGSLPRAYGLPKIHKDGVPFRIIVSSVDSPLYSLSTFLHKILFNSLPTIERSVKNSYQLVDRLSNVRIDNNYQLISLDVISLFTNIPIEEALICIDNRWDDISQNCSVTKSEFMLAVRFVLKSTFFKFNNIIYEQTHGTPMGSPLSPVVADIFLRDLERKALDSLSFCPAFYFRYVDDIAMSLPVCEINNTLDIFNSFHPRIQFSVEVGVDNCLNFLDVNVSR